MTGKSKKVEIRMQLTPEQRTQLYLMADAEHGGDMNALVTALLSEYVASGRD